MSRWRALLWGGLASLLAGCIADAGVVGPAAGKDSGGDAPDASGGFARGDANSDSSAPRPDAGNEPEAGVTCAAPQSPSSDGHDPDYDCMSANCHGPGAGVAGLLITAAGTLHSSGDAGAPVSGATVFVTDSTGQTIELVTSQTGIFWTGISDGGSVPAGPQGTCASGTCSTYAAEGALKAAVVTKCPDSKVCPTPTSGQCGQCHTYGQGVQQSVHLP